MRFVAIALLTTILGVGCAIQPAEPTDGDPSHSGDVTNVSGGGGSTRQQSTRMPQIRTTGSPVGTSTSPIPNPEPSPWNTGEPVGGGSGGGGDGLNPEPSPWDPGAAQVNGDGTGGSQSGGGSGSGQGTTSTAPGSVPHVRHWDL
jgi:hypothetical protein